MGKENTYSHQPASTNACVLHIGHGFAPERVIIERSKLFTKRWQITISYLYFRNIDIINEKGICNRSVYYYRRNKYGAPYMCIYLGISSI